MRRKRRKTRIVRRHWHSISWHQKKSFVDDISQTIEIFAVETFPDHKLTYVYCCNWGAALLGILAVRIVISH